MERPMAADSQETTAFPPREMRQLSAQARLFLGGIIILASIRFVHELIVQATQPMDWGALAIFAVGTALAQVHSAPASRYCYYYLAPTFVFAAFILMGPAAGGSLLLLSFLVSVWRQRQRWYIAAFNAAAHFLSALSAYQFYTAVVGQASVFTGVEGLGLLSGAIVYVAMSYVFAMLGVYFIYNLLPAESGIVNFEGVAIDFLLLCMGGGLAVLWRVHPALGLFGLAPLILVSRALSIPSLKERARIDPKTGLYNAGYASHVLELELRKARRARYPLSVLMADLDDLRRINNTYGHLVGDEVLKQVAEVIRSAIGSRGIAARFGGEEFVAILPDCDAQEARALAELIRKRVEGLRFALTGDDTRVRITITVGVATYPEDADEPVELLHRADAALYYGKYSGRNQVSVASALREAPTGGWRVRSVHYEEEPGEAGEAVEATEEEAPADRAAVAEVATESEASKWPLTLLVTIVVLGGMALWAVYLPRLHTLDWHALGTLVALAWIGEGLALDLYMTSTVSLGFVALLAAAFLLGPAGVAVIALVMAFTHAYRRRPPWYKVAYNLAAHTLAGTAASLVFQATGGSLQTMVIPALILPSLLAAGVNYVINVGLVVIAVALSERRNPIQVWWEQYQWLWVHYLGLGFIALVLAIVYQLLGIYGVLAFLVPLFIARYAQKQYIDRTAQNIRALKVLNQELLAANAEIRQMNEELLGLLANVIDFRDPYVYNHSEQVASYAVAIAQEMGLSAARIKLLHQAAICHDLGKIGIPEAILNKPGRLTEEEFQRVKAHVRIGAELLESSHVLHRLIPGVRHHHERWDGRGYPDRLSGEEIPLEARILAVADAVETMASDRPYKRGMSPEQILEELRRCAGTQFDPQVVEAFIRVVERKGIGFIVNSARRVAKERTEWAPLPEAVGSGNGDQRKGSRPAQAPAEVLKPATGAA